MCTDMHYTEEIALHGRMRNKTRHYTENMYSIKTRHYTKIIRHINFETRKTRKTTNDNKTRKCTEEDETTATKPVKTRNGQHSKKTRHDTERVKPHENTTRIGTEYKNATRTR